MAHLIIASECSGSIDYVTFRRLAEVLGLNTSNAHELRRNLIAGNSEHYQAPLWSVSTPHSSPGK